MVGSTGEPGAVSSSSQQNRRQAGIATLHKKRIKPGTRLIREWHGEVHDVLVLEEGFAFRGRVHRSLTAIAREITGTAWNGHRFFGLRLSDARAEPVADVTAGSDHPATESADC